MMTPLRAAVSAAILLAYQGSLYWLIKLFQRGRTYHDVQCSLDDRVPFIPAMVIPYVGSYAFWLGTYYYFARSGAAFWTLAAAILLGNTLADVFFAIWPTRMERPKIEGKGLLRFALRVVYRFDTPVNLLPSVHCLVSCVCAIAICTAPVALIWKLLAQLIALSIYASTVMVRQHRLIDIPAGILMALIAWIMSTHLPELPMLAERIFTGILTLV